MSNEILTEFIEDARDHLQKAGNHLILLEKDRSMVHELNGLLRCIHTVKGNSGFLNLNNLYNMLHRAENVLQTIREQSCARCSAELMDSIFEVLDTANMMLDQVAAGNTDNVEGLERVLAGLDDLDNALNDFDPPPEAEAPFDEVPESGGSDIEFPPFSHDLEARLQACLSRLAQWEDLEPTEEDWKEMFADLVGIEKTALASGTPTIRSAGRVLGDYLRESGSPTGRRRLAPVFVLEGLLRNLLWPLEDAGASPPDGGSVLLAPVSDHDLSNPDWPERVALYLQESDWGLVFDLRAVQSLKSREIGVLISVCSSVAIKPNPGLLMDSEVQKGLLRVLETMGLDRIFKFYYSEEDARAIRHEV